MSSRLADLCTYCQRIPAKFFSFHKDKQCSIDHHTSWIELKECASTCQLCKLLTEAIDRYDGPYANSWAKARWKETDAVRLDSTKFRQQKIAMAGSGEVGVFRGEEIPHDWSDPAELDVHMEEDELHMSEAAVIQHWEEVCSKEHKHCAELQSGGSLPTRLIYVGDGADDTIRLVITDDAIADGRYLALSHCWGKNMPASAKTTQATLGMHLEEIQFSSLSKTFCDFITIARQLKVQYVWIDSLCIVQDSAEDWEREAARMADVYSNAHLTVSASGSADGSGGCKVPDKGRSFGPVDAAFFEDPSDPDNSKQQIFRIWCRDPYPTTSRLYEDPLTKRGWCLQERELSPRVVHFSNDTIRWECRDFKATYELPWGDPIAFNGSMRLFDNGQLDSPSLGSKSLGKLSTVEYNKTVMTQRLVWFELVSRYTSRSLTRQSDVLPAISGIAQAVAESTGDEYYAGLWLSYLPYCLLWTIRKNEREKLRHSKPEAYLAPSWSWASIKGATEWSSLTIGAWHSYNPDPDPKYIPEIVHIQVEHAGSDRYGMLKDGVLKLRGIMRPAFTRHEKPMTGDKEPDHEPLYVADAGSLKTGQPEIMGRVTYDVPLCGECASPGQPNYIFVIACLNGTPLKDGTVKTFGLVLEPADGTMADIMRARFRRAGIAWFIDTRFWDDAKPATISIV